MSEGIIDLHHILFYLYKCHEQTCCHVSEWVYGMTADNHVSRGSPLIGTARQRFPRGELVWAASWLIEIYTDLDQLNMYTIHVNYVA